MTIKRVLLLLSGLIVASVVLLHYWPPRLINDGGYDLIAATPSPNGSKVAEIFAYRGGATVRGFSVLLVRPYDQKVPPEDFGARVADCDGGGKIAVSWVSDERLLVIFPKGFAHRVLKSTAYGAAIDEKQIE